MKQWVHLIVGLLTLAGIGLVGWKLVDLNDALDALPRAIRVELQENRVSPIIETVTTNAGNTITVQTDALSPSERIQDQAARHAQRRQYVIENL